MNRFKNYFWMAAAFAILAAAVSAFTPGSALAAVIKAALVKNIDEPGRSPYFASAQCTPAANACTVNFPAVPPNKRLVVQFVSGDVQSSNAVAGNALLFLFDGSNDYAFVPTVAVTTETWVAGQAVTAYIEAGAVPKLNVTLLGSTNVQATGILTGYLIDTLQ